MPPARKIAFIGSHAIRKTNAVHSFAGAVGRSGRSVEVGREVVRFSPLGMNERATPEAQLWVIMAQIREELELRMRADVLVLDRAVIDNFAYFLRVTKGQDPFDVTPLVATWSATYDLYVRLRLGIGVVIGMFAKALGDDVLFQRQFAGTHLGGQFFQVRMNLVQDDFAVLARQDLLGNVPTRVFGLDAPITTNEIQTLELLSILNRSVRILNHCFGRVLFLF